MSGSKDMLNRKQAAEHLASIGYPLSPRTLDHLARIGKGPPYKRFGWKTTCYERSELEAWARLKMLTFEGDMTPEPLPLMWQRLGMGRQGDA